MMTDREQHALVTDYLARLRAEAALRLPPDRAEELVADIRDHLGEAVPPGAGEAEVRTALDRVGDPRDLVDEAGGSTALPRTPTAVPAESNRLEVAALVCLVASLVLFIAFPVAALLLIAGLVMLLLSKRWTTVDKVLGAVAYAVLGAPALLFAGFGLTFVTYTQGCSQQMDAAGNSTSEPVCSSSGGHLPPWLLMTVGVAWLAYQLYVALRLGRGARRARTANS